MSIKLLEPQNIKVVEIITYQGGDYAFGDYDEVRVMVDGDLAVVFSDSIVFGDRFHDQGRLMAGAYLQCMKDSGFKGKIVTTIAGRSVIEQ